MNGTEKRAGILDRFRAWNSARRAESRERLKYRERVESEKDTIRRAKAELGVLKAEERSRRTGVGIAKHETRKDRHHHVEPSHHIGPCGPTCRAGLIEHEHRE